MPLFEHAEFGKAAVVIGPAISVVAFSIIFGRHSAGLGTTRYRAATGKIPNPGPALSAEHHAAPTFAP